MLLLNFKMERGSQSQRWQKLPRRPRRESKSLLSKTPWCQLHSLDLLILLPDRFVCIHTTTAEIVPGDWRSSSSNSSY